MFSWVSTNTNTHPRHIHEDQTFKHASLATAHTAWLTHTLLTQALTPVVNN